MHRPRPCPARLVTAAVLAALAMAGAGCRFVTVPLSALPDSSDATALAAEPRAAAKPEPRTIPIELVFVRHPESDPQLMVELWNLADEQVIDDRARRQLNANGLRAGVVSTRLPPPLAQRFSSAVVSDDPASDSAKALAESPAVVRRTLRLLPGRENEVLAASGISELILLERDGAEVRGATYHDASAVFTLRAWPAADGRVRVQVCPMIKHGPTERTWVGDDGVFRLETGQRRTLMDGLRFETELPADTMLIVGCSGEPSSTVGDAFCRDRSGGHAGVRLVALRPLARTPDPLFTSAE